MDARLTAAVAAFAPAVRTAAEEALGFVFPTWCAGCDQPDVTLCADCLARLSAQPQRRRLGTGADEFVVHSALEFADVPARVIRALKEDGRTSLARPLARALATAAGVAVAGAGAPVAAVPVPTSRQAMRRRGYAVTELLARRAGLRPCRLLVTRGRTLDQRGLGVAERARNATGTMHARAAADGARVLIVDDVVTTGATLIEAARALRTAGAHVVGAATVAATPRRHL